MNFERIWIAPVLWLACVVGLATAQVEPSATAGEDAGPAYAARVWGGEHGDFTVLGSLAEDSAFEAQLTFSPFGAGLEQVMLAHHFLTDQEQHHVPAQQARTIDGIEAIPFALLAVEIDAQRVDLVGLTARLWREIAPGHFEAVIEDDTGAEVARIERRFVLATGGYDIVLSQSLTNLTDEPIRVRWVQTGPISMPKEGATPENQDPKAGYGGDKRRVRFGYVTQSQIDLAANRGLLDATVTADSALKGLRWTLGDRGDDGRYEVARPLWPVEAWREKGRELVWVGMTDRYFGAIAHPIIDADTDRLPGDKVFERVDQINRYVLNPGIEDATDAVVLLEFVGPGREVGPGETDDNSMGVYAGPLDDTTLGATPMLVSLGLPDVLVYNFGGPCSFCALAFLTHPLLKVLEFNHSITQDWTLAIILLVIMVRTILHPVTRWSQIRVQRFSVQMQAMAPKQKKIREKFKDDPKRQQEEFRKLWAEEGINPAGMFGCLPMFLQTPVWASLYAMLFFAVELRHQAGFYGVFQSLSGGSWRFLSDLSAADGAIPLPEFLHFSFPLWGTVTSINLLPILLGFVFFAHQKYLTPPTSATLTPEQEQQQKIMKVMMVVMFPVFMYTAPSGLAIYFVTNSTIAIFENKWIRAHMNKHGMLDADKIKAERMAKRQAKGGGFLARMQARAQQAQQMRQQQQKMVQRKPERNVVDRKYKKRK